MRASYEDEEKKMAAPKAVGCVSSIIMLSWRFLLLGFWLPHSTTVHGQGNGKPLSVFMPSFTANSRVAGFIGIDCDMADGNDCDDSQTQMTTISILKSIHGDLSASRLRPRTIWPRPLQCLRLTSILRTTLSPAVNSSVFFSFFDRRNMGSSETLR